MHIADFDKPRLGGPAIGGARIFIEHRGSVVDYGAPILALIGDKALDRGTHPGGFLRTIRLQRSNPPIFVGILVIIELLCGLLRPVPLVLHIGG